MKSIALFAIIAFAVVCAEEQYTTKYDDVNVEEILENKRLKTQYFNCIMDRAPCNSEGKELKSKLLEAIQTDCSKCNEKHKQKSKVVIRHLINEEPGMWKELTDKYDPQGTYSKAHEAELKNLKN